MRMMRRLRQPLLLTLAWCSLVVDGFRPLSFTRERPLLAATLQSSVEHETPLPDDDDDDLEHLVAVRPRELSPIGQPRHGRRKAKMRSKNPAMADTAFLRKRTAQLLRLTELPAQVVESEASSSKLKADLKTFHFLLDAWAFSGEPDAGLQAKRLLTRLEELGQRPQSSVSPDVRSYTKAMNALARSESPEAGQEAEAMLEKMTFLSSTNPKVRPNTFTYTAAIEALAHSGQDGSASRAAELCNTMIAKYIGGDRSVTPTSRAFNAAIVAAGKAGDGEAAQALLERLTNLYYESDIEEAKPQTFNYNACISAWAKSGKPGAARRAEQVLERMEELYQKGESDAKPTVVSFNAVIDAYAKSGEEGAADRAEQILRHMEELYESGEDIKPNTRSFNSVINAWAKSGHEDAADKAQDMLDLMERLYENGNQEVRPDVHSFCTVINAWARSHTRGKAERALNLFREMKKLFKAGNKKLRPNVVAYNAVLNACAYVNGDLAESNRAVEIAHAILKDIEQSEMAKPDQVTYGTFLKVCANQMPACSSRDQIVEFLFKKCAKDGQVGNLVLQQLKAMVGEELYGQLVGRGLNEEIAMEDLPKDWWCNVVEGKWRRKRSLKK